MEKSPFTREHRALVALLREHRRRADLTQVEIAAKLKLSQSVVSKWERGDLRIDLVQIRMWCRATGSTLVAFVEEFEERLGKRKQG